MSFSDRKRLNRALPADSSCERSKEEAHQSINISSRSIKPKFIHDNKLGSGPITYSTNEMQQRIQQKIFTKSKVDSNEVKDHTSLPIKGDLNLFRKLMAHHKPLQLAGDNSTIVAKAGSTSTNASIHDFKQTTKRSVIDKSSVKINITNVLSKAQLPQMRISIKNRQDQPASERTSSPIRSALKIRKSPEIKITSRNTKSVDNFAFKPKHVRFYRLVKVSVYDIICN